MQQVDLEKLQWNTTKIAINDLVEYEHNPRSMSKKDFEKLVNNLKQDSYHQRIMIDTKNVIIGGHSRRRALLAAGYRPSDLIEVLRASRPLSEDEFKRLNIRDNLSFGDFDFDILANNFEIDNLIDWGMDANMFPNLEPELEVVEKKKTDENKLKCELCGK